MSGPIDLLALARELEAMISLQRHGRPCESGGTCEVCYCRGAVGALARLKAAQERVAVAGEQAQG